MLDMLALDHDRLASEILRAIRGRRSQRGLSRRLGYRTNISYTWESGRSFPTAARFLWVVKRCGIDVRAALARFFGTPPAWLDEVDPATPHGVVRLLNELRGRRPVVDIARLAGRTRYAVARWLQGKAEPRLPDLLRLIEALSQRLLDFLAAITDPAQLPSAAAAWERLEAMRRAAYELPWSHAVMRALELHEYAGLPRHEPGWIASRVGITVEEEQECLALLLRTGQVTKRRGRYIVTEEQAVDTRRDPRAAQRLRIWWSEVAVARARTGATGMTSYSLFTVSAADYERLRELQRSFFHQMRAIVSESQPAERIVLACSQMLDLEPPRGAG